DASTVTTANLELTYVLSRSSYSRTVTGFLNGQGPEATTTAAGYTAPSCTSSYTATTPVASSPLTISCSGGAANNYSFDTSKTAKIGRASCRETVNAQNATRP